MGDWYKLKWLEWLERGEKIGLTLLLAVALLLLWTAFRWGPDSQLIIWIFLWLAGFGLVLRRFWIGLFGPVFSFDLVRTSRRSPIFSLRCLYAGAILVILYLFYASWFGHEMGWPWELDRQIRVPLSRQAQFAHSFFAAFVGVQTAAVLLITPLAVSSAIAEEKEKKTLAFLLATDLRDHEIVLGKLASRLTHLFLFLMTGLPILTLLQFLGGIDPNLVLASFLANVLMLVGLASVSILSSVNSEKPMSALISSYLGAVGYVLIGCVCAGPIVALFTAVAGPFDEFEHYSPLAVIVVSLVLNGLVGLICCKAAVANLRRRYRLHRPSTRELILDDIPDRPVKPVLRHQPVDVRPMEEVLRERELVERRQSRYILKSNPPITGDPMLWKEQYIDTGLGLPESLRALGQIPLIVGIVMLIYFILVCGLQGIVNQDRSGPGSFEFTNGLVRVAGTGIMCLMLFGVALRAAHCVSSERDRRTLDSLLTTPLENRDILRAKWWASFLYVRKGWWFLGLTWFLGLFTLGLHLLAIPLLLFGWFMYAVFAAGLGLFFSLISPTTLRSSLATLFLLIGASLAPMAVWFIVESVLHLTGLAYQYPRLMQFDADLLVPPVALVRVTFAGQYDLLPLSGYDLGVILAGMYGYGLIGAALWSICCSRFGSMTGRMPYGTAPQTQEEFSTSIS